MPSSNCKRLSVRLISALIEKTAQDVVAKANLCALVRVALDRFIASDGRIESTQTLGLRHDSKVGEDTASLCIPRKDLKHYKGIAKTNGSFSFGALVNSALCFHYFGASPAPVVALAAKAEAAVPLSAGWSAVLSALPVGHSREITKADGVKNLRSARNVAVNAAGILRSDIPTYRITTRVSPKVLTITRQS